MKYAGKSPCGAASGVFGSLDCNTRNVKGKKGVGVSVGRFGVVNA